MSLVILHSLPVGTVFTVPGISEVSYMKIQAFIYRGVGKGRAHSVDIEEVNSVVVVGTIDHPTGTLERISCWTNVEKVQNHNGPLLPFPI